MLRMIKRVLLLLGVAASVALLAAPVAAAAPPATAGSARAAVPAAGGFVAAVDFESLVARDVGRHKCEFTVRGALTFEGTLTGQATGTTTAVIFAPCSEATTHPPGTFFDVFRFTGDFRGTVAEVPVTGTLTYAGITRVGGSIDARILLRGDRARAVLRADATVAVGGSYAGVARPG